MNPYIHIDRNKFKIKKGKMKRKKRPERCPLNSKPILKDGFVLWIVACLVNILEKSRLIEAFIIGQMDRTPVSVAMLMQMCNYKLWGRWMSPFEFRREKNEEIDGCLPRVLLFKPVGHFQYYCWSFYPPAQKNSLISHIHTCSSIKQCKSLP